MLRCVGLDDVTLGSLEDLRRAGKGGMDPNGYGAARLASDVLWSDPVGAGGGGPGCMGIAPAGVALAWQAASLGGVEGLLVWRRADAVHVAEGHALPGAGGGPRVPHQ